MKSCAIVAGVLVAATVRAATVYVSPNGNDGDGLSWENAKTTIQAGVAAAGTDGLVLVTNGVYDAGSVVGAGDLKCRVRITDNITVRSVQPHGAVIKGSGLQFHGDLANAIRCVEIVAGTLDGFIVEEGTTGSMTYNDNSLGGGIFFHDAASGYATNCVLRSCRAGGGGATFRGILQDCVISNNVATGADGGGAMYVGRAYRCLIAHNQTVDGSGGGIYGHPNGEYADCTVRDNVAVRIANANIAYGGGGAFYGTFSRCAISNNTVTGFGQGGGGGTYSSTLTDSVIAHNVATSSHGGGVCGGTLTRCLVSDNTVSYGDGGGTYAATLFQCEVLSNNLTSWHNGNGGGMTGGSAYNTLIAHNRSQSVGGTFFANLYNCTVVSNTAVSENAPGIHMFDGIKIYNCVAFGNTGSPEKPWLADCDIGALNASSDVKGTLAGKTDLALSGITLVAAGTPVFADPLRGDFSLCAGSPAFNAGDMTVPMQSVDLAGSARVLFGAVDAGAYEYNSLFVATDGSDANDGRSWANAKQSIQAAIDVSEASMTILVSNGVYNTGTVASPDGTLPNRIAITKAVRVKSVSGPAQTSIQGSGMEAFATDAAIRCVFMNSGVLDGFTVERGATKTDGWLEYQRGGGGVCMEGAAAGTLVTNCVIRNNRAVTGGGVSGGMLDPRGLATVSGCVITNNVGTYGGGGAYGAAFERCVISHNTAWGTGGGFYEPFRVGNSLVAANASADCGGVFGPGTLDNCTVVANTGSGVTGVDWGPGLHLYANNCIVWGNSGAQYGVLCHFKNTCCSTAGDGITVTSDPLFMDAPGGDFRLQPASPCVDAGDTRAVVGAADLAGGPRVVDGRVDMGAFESPSLKRVIFDAAPGVFVGLGTNRLDVYIPRAALVYGSYIPTNAVFRTGHAPDGWYSQPDGGGVAIQAETPFVSPDTHTVYQAWRRRGMMLLLF